ncbi:glycoside hydrolase family 88 protein [Cohnella fermenti]|uniref:Glycosyl hydrolase n=1 Tax=Cohnella fermenti TaxID=2565925 RepID=A0A4S4BJU0_9BACL|nr:glycosyl hydrolase [Cohnella fermenti]
MERSRETASWVEEAWRAAADKAARIGERIGTGFPHASVNGVYTLEAPHWWTAGFWPGMLWQLYEGTGNERFRTLAEGCEERLDEVLHRYEKLDHDLGFMWTLTSVASFRLTGSEESRRRALQAANYLAGRFNLKGRYIRAWNPWSQGEDNSGIAIIDCCMNMPLLYWASQTSGDPRYRHIAMAHMDTVLDRFVRPDGSVYHIVRFDSETGEKVEALGGQGYAPESAWSRGTAWAIYGLALSYHHTGERRFLDAAVRVARFFLAQLPDDSVPHWDFRLPEGVTKYRDSSAGACAASGLLLLAEQTGGDEAESFRKAAETMLESLYRSYGDWDNPGQEGLLLHGTSHYPEGKNVDVPLIYGDFFFVEGLARLRGTKTIFWTAQ